VHHGQVLYLIVFRKLPVLQIQPGDDTGIHTNAVDKRQQLPDSIGFMKAEDESEPVFGYPVITDFVREETRRGKKNQ